MVASRVFVVVVVLVGCALAADYFYDEKTCLNIQPGLWVRDINDCMIAHQCGFDGEVTQSVKCNTSQVWSKLASSCVWEWDPDRDDCNGSPMVHIPNDPRCIAQTGNSPDPEDCSKYVSCANGTLLAIQQCGEGTLYFPRNNTCEFAHKVVTECGNRRVPDTVVIREEDPMCATDGQIPDPESCKYFIVCQHGRRAQRIQCPYGTSFSPTARKCEWNKDVVCH